MSGDLLSRADVRRMLNAQRPGTLRRVRVVDRDPVAKTATVIYPNEPDPEPFEVPLTQGIVPIVDRDIWVQTPAGEQRGRADRCPQPGVGPVPVCAVAEDRGRVDPVGWRPRPPRRLQRGRRRRPTRRRLRDVRRRARQPPPSRSRGTARTRSVSTCRGPTGWPVSAASRRSASTAAPTWCAATASPPRWPTTSTAPSQTVWFAAGDYLELQVFQDSGGGEEPPVLGSLVAVVLREVLTLGANRSVGR